MFWRCCCSSGGMEARSCATSDCCCARSRPVEVPTVEALLEDIEDTGGGPHVLARDAQAILRGEHLEVHVMIVLATVRQHDHLAVEAAGDRGELRRAQRRAVLAPQVDLVARVQYGAVAGAAGRRTGAGAGHGAVEVDRGQQRGAGDRVEASACSMRATAAAMSRLASCACSTSVVSSPERKPRHQWARARQRVLCRRLRDRPAERRRLVRWPNRWSRRSGMQPDRSGASSSAKAERRSLPVALTHDVAQTHLSAPVASCVRSRRPLGKLGATGRRHRYGACGDDVLHDLLERGARKARLRHCGVKIGGVERFGAQRGLMPSKPRVSVSRAPSAAVSRERKVARSFSASAGGSATAVATSRPSLKMPWARGERACVPTLTTPVPISTMAGPEELRPEIDQLDPGAITKLRPSVASGCPPDPYMKATAPPAEGVAGDRVVHMALSGRGSRGECRWRRGSG